MKKIWMLILLAAVFAVSLGLNGCQKKEKPVDTKDVETITEEDIPPVEEPAEAKPKDHPAH